MADGISEAFQLVYPTTRPPLPPPARGNTGSGDPALVGAGAFAAAQEAAERVQPRLGVVLAGPLIQGAAGGEVIAAGWAPGRAFRQVPERLHHPFRAHVS